MCTLDKGLASRRALSMVCRALASSQLEVDATDLPESLHQPGPDFSFPKRSFGKRTVVQQSFQHAWFSKWPFLHYNKADDTVFCFTCRNMFKEKKNKTSTKADPAFVCSSLYFLSSRLSNLLRFTSFEICYEIHGIWFS